MWIKLSNRCLIQIQAIPVTVSHVIYYMEYCLIHHMRAKTLGASCNREITSLRDSLRYRDKLFDSADCVTIFKKLRDVYGSWFSQQNIKNIYIKYKGCHLVILISSKVEIIKISIRNKTLTLYENLVNPLIIIGLSLSHAKRVKRPTGNEITDLSQILLNLKSDFSQSKDQYDI